MKTDINYSYPVLGVKDDILPLPIIVSPQIIEDEENDWYEVNFNFDYDNEDIAQLIGCGKAVYCCEIECTHTLYRKRCHSDNKNFTCYIPCTAVGKDISLTFTIVAVSNIPGYTNSKCHKDYYGYSFDLSAGDVLGIFGRFKFFANLKANQFNATSDFLSIEKAADDDTIPSFDFNGDKVTLLLPEAQYNAFFDLRDKSAYEEILMSTFALQAITEAIHAISEPDNDYARANRKWVEALNNRIEAIPECSNFSRDSDAYKIAQLIMRDENKTQPFERMLDKLSKLTSR